MARLIPREISPGASVPKAEREILQELARENEISRDWIVLHSLEIRKHIYKLQGEIDFLVLAPGLGLLGVEVKGCDVTRKEGVWTYHYSPPKTSSEGPFKQANSAMHSLRKWLSEHGATEVEFSLRHSCVVFTEIEFKQQSPEWNPWEIVDRSDIARYGVVSCLQRVMEREHANLSEQKRRGKVGASWYDAERSRPSLAAIEQVAGRLRPDFGYEGAKLADVERLEKAIEHATEEQVEFAMGAVDNDRLVLKGAAGTGKTFLALRLAQLWAAEGKRVGLLCFNSFLAAWMISQVRQELGASGFVGSFHSLMLERGGISPPENPDSEFWNALPGLVSDKLIAEGQEPLFDVLIVDEAQDLLKPEIVDVLDLLLVNGLRGGRWVFAGDFSRQAIYAQGRDEVGLLEQLHRRGIEQAVFQLTINCRNANRVAANVALLGGLQPRYRSTLHSEQAGNVKAYFVSGTSGATRKLQEVLVDLKTRFRSEDIVVLSPHVDSTAASLHSSADSPQMAAFDRRPRQGFVGYCTIHAFKGLEAAAIVLTDIRGWDSAKDEALFYIGISRARVEAHLILNKSQEPAYQQRILQAIADGA